MNGIDWLQTWLKNYRQWKLFQTLPEAALARGFWPSETYCKHAKHSTFEGRKVLNLGCGTSVYPSENVTNLDGYAGEGVNCVWDLSKTPLPFKDQEFDLIIANHVMEHIPNWFECFKEMSRITKVGGTIEVWIPPISSDSAFSYRDHINRIGIESFWGCLNFVKKSNNLWANTHESKLLGNVRNLRITNTFDRVAMFWWVYFAPKVITTWMVRHLRNIVSETGFLFKKESHSND